MWCDAPKSLELANLLTDLLGRQTKVKDLPAQTRQLSGPVTVFVNPDKVPAAVAVSDFEFAAFAGAVLTLLPAGVANEAVKKKAIDGTLAENLGEVLNVVSSKLTKSPNRVIMRLPFTISTTVPEDAKAIKLKPQKRVDYDVEIAGYGEGKITFFLT
jgi:hypothetical protein